MYTNFISYSQLSLIVNREHTGDEVMNCRIQIDKKKRVETGQVWMVKTSDSYGKYGK